MNNDYDEEVKKAAEEAFSNTSRLTNTRLGPRDTTTSPSHSSSDGSSSRRSPSMIKTKDEAGLFEVMSSATSVVLSRRKKKQDGSAKSPPTVPTTTTTTTPTTITTTTTTTTKAPPTGASSPVQDMLNSVFARGGTTTTTTGAAAGAAGAAAAPPSDTKSTATGTGTTTTTSSGGTMKNLDLANNDNSFFVIANLLVDYFQARVVQSEGSGGGGDSDDKTDSSADAKLLLQPADKESLERLLPKQARSNFIQAVQERLGNTPSVPTTPLQFLTLQCQELNLDQDDEVNPLLTVLELTTDPVLIEILPSSALRSAMASASFTATATAVPDPVTAAAAALTTRTISPPTITIPTTTKPTSPTDATPTTTTIVSPTNSQMTEKLENLTSKRASSSDAMPGGASGALAASTILTSVQEDKKDHVVAGGSNNFFGGMPTAMQSSTISTPQMVPTPPVVPYTNNNVTGKATPTPKVQEQPSGRSVVEGNYGRSIEEEASVEPIIIVQPDPSGDNDSAHTFERNVDCSRTESLARQQLLAELREASNLMANSVTSETAKFWRDHVLELQARLRALHGEGNNGTNSSGGGGVGGLRNTQSPTPEDILESNRRLLSEFQQREQYIPPVIDSPSIKSLEQAQAQQTKTTGGEPGFGQAGGSGGNNIVGSAAVDAPSMHGNMDYSKTPPSKFALRKDTPQTPGSNNDAAPHHLGPPTSRTPMTQGGGFDNTPVVDVVAPADLPGGYRFEAEIEGQRFLAVVPPGGVREGDTFSCFMRELDSVAIDIPVGYWKDGAVNWFKFGVCHQVVWNSIVCPLILLGQITTRVDFDFIGRPRDGSVGALSNRSMMLLVIGFWLLMNVGLFAGYNAKWSQDLELSVADLIALVLVNGSMFGFIVFATQSTRSSIREKFMIRENCCYDLEDLCCATFCLPCTLSQMARHTANYNDYEAVCCSKSGLPDGVKVNQQAVKNNETYVV